MFSPAVIADFARQAAVAAFNAERVPYAPDSVDEIKGWKSYPFTNLGDYRPDGWRLIEYTQIDKGGEYDGFSKGLPQIKAWCIERLQADPTAGFAVIEEGQFQAVVGYFSQNQAIEPVDGDANGRGQDVVSRWAEEDEFDAYMEEEDESWADEDDEDEDDSDVWADEEEDEDWVEDED